MGGDFSGMHIFADCIPRCSAWPTHLVCRTAWAPARGSAPTPPLNF